MKGTFLMPFLPLFYLLIGFAALMIAPVFFKTAIRDIIKSNDSETSEDSYLSSAAKFWIYYTIVATFAAGMLLLAGSGLAS